MNLEFNQLAKQGNLDELKRLYSAYKNEIEVNWENGKQSYHTALHHAANHGHFDTVQWLLRETNADIHHEDYMGETPIHLAAFQGYSNVVRLLLENGARKNHQTHVTEDSPLTVAVYSGSAETVTILLDQGADASIRNLEGMTAMTRAAECDKAQIIDTLLMHPNGVGVNDRDDEGMTALMWACRYANKDAALVLLQHAADFALRQLGGMDTALHWIANKDDDEGLVAILLASGSNLYARNAKEETALMIASESRCFDAVNRLLVHESLLHPWVSTVLL
mmetsp:Transcript_14607/g.25230  ORF Transcript_14607/g.25230 Transcript_14607/m.25230 type:complete len:279 (+) Transcript_14607:124-960(+)